MTDNVIKTVPSELNTESRYAMRIRSFNAFGTPSNWSESLIVDTSAAGLASARRLMITGDGMVAYDSRGQMVFNFASTPLIRTNLVSNPSFEVNTVGWEALTNTSISRYTSDFFVGTPGTEASLRVQATAAAGSIGFVSSSVRRISAVQGLPYTVTAFIKVPTGQPPVGMKIGFRFYSAAGAMISEVVSFVTNQIKSADNWVRISNVAITAPNGTSTLGVVIYSSTNFASGQNYLVDGIMVEQSAILREYFDGSTSKDQTTWTGLAHDSASILDTNTSYSVNGGVFTEATIQTNREPNTGIKITKEGIRGYSSGPTPVETFFLDAATGALSINGAAPPTGDKIPIGGAAADVNSNSTTISGNKIRTGSITSNGYVGVLDGSAFSTTGTTFNLLDGTISSKNWRINASGDVFFVGAIAGGTIDIGGSDSSSFHVDGTGNMWLGSGTFAGAPFSVSSTGAVVASSVTLTGANVTGVFQTAGVGDRIEMNGATLTLYSTTNVSGSAAAKIVFNQTSSTWFSRIESNAGIWLRAKTDDAVLRSELILAGSSSTPEFSVLLSNGSAPTTVFLIQGSGPTGLTTVLTPLLVNNSITTNSNIGVNGIGVAFNGSNIVGTGNLMGLRWDAGFASIMGTVDNVAYATLGTVSDRRLKHNINPLSSVKKDLMKLNPVTFYGKDFDGSVPRPDHRMAGFIADEVEKIIPNLVAGEATDNSYQTVNYALLTPYLLKAVQELYKENEAIRKRLLKLEKTQM